MPKPNIINSSICRLLFLILLLCNFPVASVNAQETESESPVEETAEPSETEAETPPGSIFSIEGGKRLMDEADTAIDNQEYDVAAQKLQSARQVFNQLSNFYLQLFNSFTGLDNNAAESHRKKALETSLERDNATYELALVHRLQGQPELSIPLLVQIITSQSPGVGLGKKAYEQLLEIGFVDTPYTRPGTGNNPPVELPPASEEAPATPDNAAPQTPPADIPPAIPTVPDSNVPQ